jgi:hypothetical protein
MWHVCCSLRESKVQRQIIIIYRWGARSRMYIKVKLEYCNFRRVRTEREREREREKANHHAMYTRVIVGVVDFV